jgi:translation elongation factor EF-Tu-like GTPase
VKETITWTKKEDSTLEKFKMNGKLFKFKIFHRALKKPIIWEEVEEEIKEMNDGYSDISFDFCPVIKIQAKQVGVVAPSKSNATTSLMSAKKEETPQVEKKTYTTLKATVETKKIEEPKGGWTIDDLETLSGHLKEGRMTQKEFDTLKKKILGL